MDNVLAIAQKALYDDMSQFLKRYAHAEPPTIERAVETGVTPETVSEKCEQLKKMCDVLKAENVVRV